MLRREIRRARPLHARISIHIQDLGENIRETPATITLHLWDFLFFFNFMMTTLHLCISFLFFFLISRRLHYACVFLSRIFFFREKRLQTFHTAEETEQDSVLFFFFFFSFPYTNTPVKGTMKLHPASNCFNVSIVNKARRIITKSEQIQFLGRKITSAGKSLALRVEPFSNLKD